MKEEEQFDLIAGIFTPSDAKEILISLINDKIRFHNLKMLSHEERFGVKDSRNIKRIEQLTKSKAQIQKLIASFEKKKKNLVINSTIVIKTKDL